LKQLQIPRKLNLAATKQLRIFDLSEKNLSGFKNHQTRWIRLLNGRRQNVAHKKALSKKFVF
jgi:hypothetical protein